MKPLLPLKHGELFKAEPTNTVSNPAECIFHSKLQDMKSAVYSNVQLLWIFRYLYVNHKISTLAAITMLATCCHFFAASFAGFHLYVIGSSGSLFFFVFFAVF